jgi:predicted kinase
LHIAVLLPQLASALWENFTDGPRSFSHNESVPNEHWTAALSDSTLLREKSWIVLCWGAPAAGKSTVSRAFAASLDFPVPRLSTDGINAALIGSHFDQTLRPVIYSGLLTMAEGILHNSRGVLLDGTFVRYESRQEVALVARRCGAVFVSVHVDCPLALRLTRNRLRAGAERVPDRWLRDAHARAHHGGSDQDLRIDTSQVSLEKSVALIRRQLLGALKRRHGLVRKKTISSG